MFSGWEQFQKNHHIYTMKGSFTKAIFWDTNIDNLDAEKHALYIIERVLNYGRMEDWHQLKKLYSLEGILEKAQKIKDLHPRTLSFLSLYFDIPKSNFACYTQNRSDEIHFPY